MSYIVIGGCNRINSKGIYKFNGNIKWVDNDENYDKWSKRATR